MTTWKYATAAQGPGEPRGSPLKAQVLRGLLEEAESAEKSPQHGQHRGVQAQDPQRNPHPTAHSACAPRAPVLSIPYTYPASQWGGTSVEMTAVQSVRRKHAGLRPGGEDTCSSSSAATSAHTSTANLCHVGEGQCRTQGRAGHLMLWPPGTSSLDHEASVNRIPSMRALFPPSQSL